MGNQMSDELKKAGYKVKDKPPENRGNKQQSRKGGSMNFYTDASKETLTPELLDTQAETQAGKFFYSTRRGDERSNLTRTQLRRFFNDIKSLQKRAQKEDFSKVKPHLKMVRSKVAYAYQGDNKKIPKEFNDFMNDCISSVDDKKDFEAFVLYFEAVVGFCYGKGIR